MADLRAHPPNEASDGANAPSGSTDPFAQLARLIGQNDPSVHFGHPDTCNPAISPDWHAEPAHTLPDRRSEQDAGALNFDVRSYRGYGIDGSDASQSDFHSHGHGDDRRVYELDEIEREEIYRNPRRAPRRARLTVVSVVALALIGTAGASAYRAMSNGWGLATPAVIKADMAQSKVTPAIQTNEQLSNQMIQDRVASSQPEAAGVAVSEPKKVRTIVLRPDQPDPSGRPAAAPPNPPVQGPSGSAGGSYVQVSSQRSEIEAQASFRALQGRYPKMLGDKQPVIRRAELGDKGVYYRAMVGPFARVEQAAELCSSLKVAGGQCVLQRN
jgi:hypothetical protein